ncbi:cbb3-type cytochrome c oxidase subunit 3 [Caenibius sp. WL]|uniref:cbb3-type cytochrome c oxidase subunit 3 n=1 Tax=Caenibius sp. WL TaxID=2872646 RepID=UPI001C99AA06|nr:cbb3-type cytochrome c oxidase subunit 3 [Caenibius sp. WL]QZP07171.1 cbb3-type cytochrome c oxidase subunit 3 [Caenibius sp. WL]
MSDHSLYDFLRHLADSWGLVVMVIAFVILAAWPFRPSARERNRKAANLIFKDKNDG